MKLRDTIAIEYLKISVGQDAGTEGLENYEPDNQEGVIAYLESLARGAYLMADAMLRVREEV